MCAPYILLSKSIVPRGGKRLRYRPGLHEGSLLVSLIDVPSSWYVTGQLHEVPASVTCPYTAGWLPILGLTRSSGTSYTALKSPLFLKLEIFGIYEIT